MANLEREDLNATGINESDEVLWNLKSNRNSTQEEARDEMLNIAGSLKVPR